MTSTTTNLGLKKPDYGEVADVAILNENYDKIDMLSNMVLFVESTDAITRLLTNDGSGSATLTGSSINVLTLEADCAHKFRVDAVARRIDLAGEAAGWEFSGVVARDATADPYFVGNIEGRAWGSVDAAAWDMTMTIVAGTTPYLAITATGETGKTIRWVATLYVTEVG